MKALILAAGYATRLYPLTLNTPKPLLKVGKKLMVEHILDKMYEVDEIDEKGLAWVWKSWPDTDESCFTHGLGLEPHQMRRVD